MTSIGVKLMSGVTNVVVNVPLAAAFGACGGYIYAKLAGLPAGQAAKAYAIYAVAMSAVQNFLNATIEDEDVRTVCIGTLQVAVQGFTIHELSKRGLMGDKLKIVIGIVMALNILSTAAAAVSYLQNPVVPKPQS